MHSRSSIRRCSCKSWDGFRPKSSKLAIQCKKKPEHNKQHGNKQLLAGAPDTPEDAAAMMAASGFQPVDACGHKDGNWVSDASITEVLEFLVDNASKLAWDDIKYELKVVYLDAYSRRVLIPDSEAIHSPQVNQLWLITHTLSESNGYHFSSMVLNSKNKIIHVFDTLGAWSNLEVEEVIRGLYPRCKLLGQGYKIMNHTGKIKQLHSTCGPCSLWCLCAYALNYREFRSAADDLDLNKLNVQENSVLFWKAVTR